MQATAKVMRSYDYCHFEITLTEECADLDAVDELRKKAAILVDEAVRQYRVAKAKESARQGKEWEKEKALDRVKRIEEKPRGEWTPEEAAIMRAVADKSFFESFDDDDYCYADPEREHHFSMLRKFQGKTDKTRIKVG